MRIVAREQTEELRSREARRLQEHSEQAAAALEHSRLRKLRAMRLARLKARLSSGSSSCSGSTPPNPLHGKTKRLAWNFDLAKFLGALAAA